MNGKRMFSRKLKSDTENGVLQKQPFGWQKPGKIREFFRICLGEAR